MLCPNLGALFRPLENHACLDRPICLDTLIDRAIKHGYLTKGDLPDIELKSEAMLAFVLLTYGAACVMLGSGPTRNPEDAQRAAP